VITVLLNHKQV